MPREIYSSFDPDVRYMALGGTLKPIKPHSMCHAVLAAGGAKRHTGTYFHSPKCPLSLDACTPALQFALHFTFLPEARQLLPLVHPLTRPFRVSFIYLLIFGGCVEEFRSLYCQPQTLFLIGTRDPKEFPTFSVASVCTGCLLKRRHQTGELDRGSVCDQHITSQKLELTGSQPVDG